MKTPSIASKRWSWAETWTRTSGLDLTGSFMGGGGLVRGIERLLRLEFSRGLVGTDTFGDVDGMGEPLVKSELNNLRIVHTQS
jgi:hypothetical protein